MSKSKKNAIFGIFTVSILLLLFIGAAEYVLRLKGYQPTVFVSDFVQVDSLIHFSDYFYSDSLGIQKMRKYRDIYDVLMSVNSDGFRSEEFLADTDTIESILFLGDSHTYGGVADPISDCFIDRLGREGYRTYNTGIIGADPAQYMAIALHYIPILKPDNCFLIFDETGDIMWYRKDPKPGIPLDYYTNSGAIRAWKSQWTGVDNEHFNSAREAYDFYLDNYSMAGKSNGTAEKLIGKTALGTVLYKLLSGWKDPMLNANPSNTNGRYEVTDFYLNKIDSICTVFDVNFEIFILADKRRLGVPIEELKEEFPGLFENFSPLKPMMMRPEDYPSDDCHMNSQGHKKMADFIQKHL